MASFRGQLALVRNKTEMTQSLFAAALGFSKQYQNDLEKGRRLPSVNYVNRLCAYLGRGPVGCATWHQLAAHAHGWKITPSDTATGTKMNTCKGSADRRPTPTKKRSSVPVQCTATGTKMNELIERLRHRQSAFMHFEDVRAMKEAADAIEAMRDVVEAARPVAKNVTPDNWCKLIRAFEKLDKLNE